MRNHCLLTILAILMCLSPAWAKQPDFLPLNPDLDTMIGQMLMVGFRGLSVNENSPVVRDIRDRHLGSVILFDYDVALHKPERNIASPGQIKKLITDLKRHATIPLLVAVDQEGGQVARLKPKHGFPALPSAQELGQHDTEKTRDAGKLAAKTLKKMGINWDLAPVVDVNVNPCSPAIGNLGRSFSPDPHQVVAHAEAFITGLHEHGVLSCLKHFPGHGSAMSDSHKGLTDVSSTWSPQELIPYRQLVSKGLCDAIMTAHIFNKLLDPRFPATLSRATLTDLLRRDMGFDGVILTDDMQMGAITNEYGLEQAMYHALRAGADILVFGNNLEYDPDITSKAIGIMKNLVTSGKISRARIAQSFARIMKLKKNCRF